MTRFRTPRLAAGLALVAAAAVLLSACSAGSPQADPAPATSGMSSPSAPASSSVSSAAPSPSASAKPGKPVEVGTFEGDGTTWGIGMAIIANFSRNAPTTSRYFTKAVTVTVNGQPANGAWFFQNSNNPAYTMQAIYRQQNYWPAHAKIHVNMPLKGLSAGVGLSFANSLTLDMQTGAATIGTVSNSHLTLVKDGRQLGVYPLALGANDSPTLLGTKVIMEKDKAERMVGSGYDEIVPWSMRLTSSGEYLHAAGWNISNIEAGRPSSNGCSNMLPSDAASVWQQVEVGDVIQYPPGSVPNNTAGNKMPSWDGFGWWNLSWDTIKSGGLLINHGS